MWTACYYNFNYNSASFLFVVAFSKKTSFVPKVAKSKRWKWRIRCKSFFSFTKPCATKLSPWYIKESSRKHTRICLLFISLQPHSFITVASVLLPNHWFIFFPFCLKHWESCACYSISEMTTKQTTQTYICIMANWKHKAQQKSKNVYITSRIERYFLLFYSFNTILYC